MIRGGEVQSSKPQTEAKNFAGGEHRRKRGRPWIIEPAAEIDPGVLHRAVLEVKGMAREYARGDLQGDVRYIQSSRPRLLRNADIHEDENGNLSYDVQRVSAMIDVDHKVVSRYIRSRVEIQFLQDAVSNLPTMQLREFASDALLEGIPCSCLADKYGKTNRTMTRWKRAILEYMAQRWLSMEKSAILI